MVTPEERITRLEAALEASVQRFNDVISRQDALLTMYESLRREMTQSNEAMRREMTQSNEAMRREMTQSNEAMRREMTQEIEAARREAREMNEATRKESREMNETARREGRNQLIAACSIGAVLFTGANAGIFALLFRVLERLPA